MSRFLRRVKLVRLKERLYQIVVAGIVLESQRPIRPKETISRRGAGIAEDRLRIIRRRQRSLPVLRRVVFPVLKEVLPEDGQIGLDEQFYLLKMLYWDGTVRDSEKQFLRELKSEAKTITPEFEQLCETAFNANPTNWDVGGR